MPDLIQTTRFDFPKLQSLAAEAIVLSRRVAGEFGDENQASEILRQLLKKIDKITGPLTVAPDFQAFERISSEKWNTFIDSLAIDLSSLYTTINTLEASNRQMDTIVASDISQTKASILKAINQLRVYQFLKDNPDYQDLKLVDFLRNVNETSRSPAAKVDNDIRMLELPAVSSTIVSLPKTGSRKTSVSVKVFGAGTLSGFSDDFSPANMLSPNQKIFWVEVLSSKSPIQQTHVTSWGPRECYGAVAEITITLSHVERINNLKLLPFFEFPYNIIDIAYKESRDSSSWSTVPNFSIREAVEDWEEFDFTYIPVDQLRITIEQPNYIRNISTVPESVLRKNQLWSLINKSDLTRTVHELNLDSDKSELVKVEPEQLKHLVALENLDTQLSKITMVGERHTKYTDYAKYIETINSIVDQISPGTANEVREVVTGGKDLIRDEIRTITSYDYLFGLRVVQLSSITYSTHAYYESPEFVTNGTVIEVSLETEEQHPLFKETDGTATYKRTSIEYDIETSPDTRFPIVPLNDLEGTTHPVRDEYVRLTNGKGKLRFTAVGNAITIRKNGKRLPIGTYTCSGRDVIVDDPEPAAVYTASYSVAEDATKIKFDDLLNSTRLLRPEEFTATDTDNKIVLKYYPYIIYDIVRDLRMWAKSDIEAKWSWQPDFYPVASGTIALTKGSTAVTLTKNSVSDPGFNTLSFISGVPLKVWVQDTGEILDIDSSPSAAISDTLCYLKDVYPGDSIASSRFILGQTVTYDNQSFGLHIDTYEPIQVYVNNVKAINKTNYYSREHPAFSSVSPGEAQYEYIQAGKVLYFNGPIKGNIKVVYSWLTQYLKLIATLRCNVPVATIFSPKIDTAKIRVKTTEL